MNWLMKIAKSLLRGLLELSPNCKTAVRLQSAALEHKLSFRRWLGLRCHILLCQWCRRYGQHIIFLRHAAQAHPDKLVATLPPQLSEAARARIRQQLRSNQK